MSQHKHRHRKSFLSSAGYYILVVILIVCLAMMVKVNRSKRAERDDYKATLSQQETVEDLGNITITKPTDAPEDAVVRNTDTTLAKTVQKKAVIRPRQRIRPNSRW